MIFALVQDFADALEAMPAGHPRRPTLTLLDEAVRRDVHFIDRHPTALFQCLWNSCWWYDCPAAAGHYGAGAGGGAPASAPWNRPGDRLFSRLESWRVSKEIATPGFRWVRSIRPPRVPLGAAQLAVFSGHMGAVRGVAVSPDGQCVTSAGDDDTVRVWVAGTGAPLFCLSAGQGGVASVAYSPDGRRLVSGGADGTVRVWGADSGAALGVLRGHAGEVLSAVFTRDGTRIVSGGGFGSRVEAGGRRMDLEIKDFTVRVWDAAGHGQLLCVDGYEYGGGVRSVAVSADGRRILTAGDRELRIRDAATGRLLGEIPSHTM